MATGTKLAQTTELQPASAPTGTVAVLLTPEQLAQRLCVHDVRAEQNPLTEYLPACPRALLPRGASAIIPRRCWRRTRWRT